MPQGHRLRLKKDSKDKTMTLDWQSKAEGTHTNSPAVGSWRLEGNLVLLRCLY